MKLLCYYYSANGRQFLGGVKETHRGFSLLLQDKKSPYSDLLGEDKELVFDSMQQALAYLEHIICRLTGAEEIQSGESMIGDF